MTTVADELAALTRYLQRAAGKLGPDVVLKVAHETLVGDDAAQFKMTPAVEDTLRMLAESVHGSAQSCNGFGSYRFCANGLVCRSVARLLGEAD